MDEADTRGYADHLGRGGTLVTVRANDQDAAWVEHTLEHGEAWAARTTVAPIAAAPMATGPNDAIQVIKEGLLVGKCEVEGGAVRVTSRVVAMPVEQQMTLREERVIVERRPTNRSLTGVAGSCPII